MANNHWFMGKIDDSSIVHTSKLVYNNDISILEHIDKGYFDLIWNL